MSTQLNTYNKSFDGLMNAAEIITKDVQDIHTKSSTSGLSVETRQSLQERINKCRDEMKCLAKQIHEAICSIPNQKNYSMQGFNEVLGFVQFANVSLAVDEANSFWLGLAERNITQQKG